MTERQCGSDARTLPVQVASVGTAVKSGARTPRATNPYRSKWEAAFANKLELEKQAGIVKQWAYEPMSFKLSKGKRYRPDFLVQYPDGLERCLEFVEVKGKWGKNRRDGLTHLKWAAQLYPMFRWTLTWRQGQGWESENVEV